MASEMRATMARQPDDLARILEDAEPAHRAADRIRGHRVWLVGTGTGWHAANQGAWMLRTAGVEAWPLQAADAALYGPAPRAGDALLVLSHRNTKRFTSVARDAAQASGVEAVVISGLGAGGDVETVAQETSAAYTASHTACLLRLAQIAVALGGDLGPLHRVPDAVAEVLAGPGPGVAPPRRLLEFTGVGPNQWTAAEGALKVRETAYLATEGLAAEQLFHGPSVALGPDDALVVLDGGGPGAERLNEIGDAAERFGVRVHRIVAQELGEQLSIFPLTVAVQRIALEAAEALGTNPDSFGRDRPGQAESWGALAF